MTLGPTMLGGALGAAEHKRRRTLASSEVLNQLARTTAPFYDTAAHAAAGGGDGPNMGAHDARASEGEHARRRKPMREAAAPEAASSALYGGVSGVAGGDGHALPTAFNVRSSFDGSRRLHGDSFGGAPDFDMGMGAKTLSSLSLSELDQMHDFE